MIPAGQSVDHSALIAFGSRHALVVLELQESFTQWLGADGQQSWDVDLMAGTLKLGGRTLAIQLMGSHAHESDTWLWAWANGAYEDPRFDGVLAASKWLRDGSPDRQAAWELTTGMFPMGPEMSQTWVPGWPLQFACFAWLRPRAMFSGDYGAGRFLCSIHDESVPVFGPDPVRFPRMITEATSVVSTSHLDLVGTYAQWFGLGFTGRDGVWTLTFPSASYELTFDAQQRLTEIKGHLAPESR